MSTLPPASDVSETLAPDYFDRVYAADADPWRFDTSDYERAKYAATVAALPKPRHDSGFEIGCSIGVLTQLLADRCQRLLAVDVSAQALAKARQRLAGCANVRLRRMRVPQEMPDVAADGMFDLIVLSEVGYYWSRADLDRVVDWLLDSLETDGALVLVHWTHPVHDYPQTGDAVHDRVGARVLAAGWVPVRANREPDYRLDVWTKRAR